MHTTSTQGRDSQQESAENRKARLYNKALDLLARREHSRRELEQKLAQTAGGEQAAPLIQVILDKLVEQGLQSDERFTEAYVNMRARKGFGPTRIARELSGKGVCSELATLQLYERTDWHELTHQTWQKKFGRLPVDYADKARQIRFLLYRGYEMDSVQRLLDGVE